MIEFPGFNWENRAFKTLTSAKNDMQQSVCVCLKYILFSEISHILVIWGMVLRANT